MMFRAVPPSSAPTLTRVTPAAVAGDGLELEESGGRRRQRVPPRLGLETGVGVLAGEHGVELGRGLKPPGAADDLPRPRHTDPHVGTMK